MDYVLTLIGEALDPSLAERIRAQLDEPGAVDWLSLVACDIPLPAPADRATIISRLNDATTDVTTDIAIDFALQPKKARRKKLLAADMDSTIIKEETLDLLAAHHGCKSQVAAITEKAMQGKINFVQALSERVALLKGLEENILARILDEDIHIRPSARTLAATMRARGAQCLLLSGGFEKLVRPIAERTGFIHGDCNRFEIKNGALTGSLIPPIRNATTKKTELVKQAQKMNIDLQDVIAVGDGSNDRPMIETAGLGVAFHAKPVLAASADVHIRHHDLTALLYLQGYRRDEFVED